MLGAPAGSKGFLVNEKIATKDNEHDGLLEVGVIINNKCNRDCEYCIYPPQSQFKKECDKIKLLKAIHAVIKNNSLHTIAVIGREPLLDVELLSELSGIAETNSLNFGFITNGMLLNQKQKEVQAMKLSYMDISFHDPIVKTIAIKNFKKCEQINGCVVLHEKNAEQIENKLEYLLKTGIENIVIALYIDNKRAPTLILKKETLLRAIEKIKNVAKKNKIRIIIDVYEESHRSLLIPPAPAELTISELDKIVPVYIKIGDNLYLRPMDDSKHYCVLGPNGKFYQKFMDAIKEN